MSFKKCNMPTSASPILHSLWTTHRVTVTCVNPIPRIPSLMCASIKPALHDASNVGRTLEPSFVANVGTKCWRHGQLLHDMTNVVTNHKCTNVVGTNVGNTSSSPAVECFEFSCSLFCWNINLFIFHL